MTSAPTPVIRELRWSDAEPFFDLYWELYDERDEGLPIGITLYRDRPGRADEVAWFSNLYQRVLNGEWVSVVAEIDGRPVGHCEIWPVHPGPPSENSHVGELGIVVDRRHRGMGCGGALIARALELARGRFEIVRLSAFATNTRAQALYARLGFVMIGRVPATHRRGDQYIDEVLMVLDLRGPPRPRG